MFTRYDVMHALMFYAVYSVPVHIISVILFHYLISVRHYIKNCVFLFCQHFGSKHFNIRVSECPYSGGAKHRGKSVKLFFMY